MKKRTKGNVQMRPRTMLQIRVVHQDQTGSIHDVTQDDERSGEGLRGLQKRSSTAHSGLLRTREFLTVLALAVENREQVDAALVRRILGELETELSYVGDLGCYVRYTEGLFEGAMALPYISGIRPEVFDVPSKKEDRSLALAS